MKRFWGPFAGSRVGPHLRVADRTQCVPVRIGRKDHLAGSPGHAAPARSRAIRATRQIQHKSALSNGIAIALKVGGQGQHRAERSAVRAGPHAAPRPPRTVRVSGVKHGPNGAGARRHAACAPRSSRREGGARRIPGAVIRRGINHRFVGSFFRRTAPCNCQTTACASNAAPQSTKTWRIRPGGGSQRTWGKPDGERSAAAQYHTSYQCASIVASIKPAGFTGRLKRPHITGGF